MRAEGELTWGEILRQDQSPTWRQMAQRAEERSWTSVKHEDGLLSYYVSEHLGSFQEDRYSAHRRCPIPSHPDEHPSFRIEGERWVCSCTNAFGDIGDLIERVENLDNSEALRRALDIRDEFQARGWRNHPERPQRRPVTTPDFASAIAAGQLDALNSDFYDRNTLVELLESKRIRHLIDGGILIETWKLAFQPSGALAAPHYTRDGRITGFKERRDPASHWTAAAGSKFPSLYGDWLDRGLERMIITEGETDTWLLWSLFGNEDWDVLGLPSGAQGPRPEWLAICEDREVVLAFDADTPGRNAAGKWASALAGLAKAVSVAQFDEGHDACSTSDARSAVEEAQPITASTSRIRANDQGTGYVRATANGLVAISNWVFVPTHRLRFVDDPAQHGYKGFLADDLQRHPVTLLMSDLTSVSRITNWASQQSGGRTWKGSPKDVAELGEHLRFQSPLLPVLNTVRTSGLHGGVFVMPGQIIGPPGAESGWWLEPLVNITGSTRPGRGQSDPLLSFPSDEETARALGIALDLNQPEVITPVLAWLAAAPLRSLTDQFPLLAVQGQSGAGKTAMTEVLLEAWYGNAELQNIGSTTTFVDSVSLTRSNVIPLALDEYRGGRSPKQRQRIAETDELVRAAYRRSGSLKRGEVKASGTGVRELRMNRPLLILGETVFEDLAVRERSVIVHPTHTGRNTTAFSELTNWSSLNSGGIGGRYLQWLVETMPELLAGEHPLPLVGNPTDRPSINLAILELGWELLNEFAASIGAPRVDVPLSLDSVTDQWRREVPGNPIWYQGIGAALDASAKYADGRKPIVFNHTGPEATLCIQVEALFKWMEREGFDVPGNSSSLRRALHELFPTGTDKVKRYFTQPHEPGNRSQVFDTGIRELEQVQDQASPR